jgi:hypothetical protein
MDMPDLLYGSGSLEEENIDTAIVLMASAIKEDMPDLLYGSGSLEEENIDTAIVLMASTIKEDMPDLFYILVNLKYWSRSVQ